MEVYHKSLLYTSGRWSEVSADCFTHFISLTISQDIWQRHVDLEKQELVRSARQGPAAGFEVPNLRTFRYTTIGPLRREMLMRGWKEQSCESNSTLDHVLNDCTII